MKKTVDCTFCDGHAEIRIERKELNYRKEEFCINQYYYKCRHCGEEFTTNEIDEMSLLQLHNQYRAKHSIPFVHEIIGTREKYGLAASKMNEVLGLGANSYSNFEKGDMPSLAMANLLRLAEKPAIFKDMVMDKKEYFSDKSFEDLIRKIDSLSMEDYPSSFKVDLYDKACSSNGFRKPDMKRISNLFGFYLNECVRNFNDKLKLNKLLFYTDFLNYKYNGSSISGLSYRAINHGPAPSYYDMLFTYLESENVIETDWEQSDNRGGIQIFTPTDGFDANLFSLAELDVVGFIIEKFRGMPSWDLRNLSHEEVAWKECFPNKEIIDYQKYAHTIAL